VSSLAIQSGVRVTAPSNDELTNQLRSLFDEFESWNLDSVARAAFLQRFDNTLRGLATECCDIRSVPAPDAGDKAVRLHVVFEFERFAAAFRALKRDVVGVHEGFSADEGLSAPIVGDAGESVKAGSPVEIVAAP
jgi:hypothetical protein